jgi:hypothetical protein
VTRSNVPRATYGAKSLSSHGADSIQESVVRTRQPSSRSCLMICSGIGRVPWVTRTTSWVEM